MITIHNYLILSAGLFFLGFLGVILRRDLMIILMSLEIMTNAVNLAFVALSRYLGKMDGQVVAVFVIALAAVEAAIGLGIFVVLHKQRELLTHKLQSLKG